MQPVEEAAAPIKPEIGPVFHTLGKLFYRVTGWKFTGHVPNVPKAILVGAPHTSNFDGLLAVTASWVARRKLRWVIKSDWTRPPIGWITKPLGAVGIDRATSRGFVDSAVQAFRANEQMFMAITPEGTRRKTDHWKTGFYWIAIQAEVPIFLMGFDYEHREMRVLTPALMPTGDLEADMAFIWRHYADIKGRYPERTGEMRIRATHQNKK